MQRKMNKGMLESRGVGGAPEICIFLLIEKHISKRGADYATNIITGPPRFSDLPTSLFALSWVQILAL